jgi:hypothetical protein
VSTRRCYKKKSAYQNLLDLESGYPLDAVGSGVMVSHACPWLDFSFYFTYFPTVPVFIAISIPQRAFFPSWTTIEHMVIHLKSAEMRVVKGAQKSP